MRSRLRICRDAFITTMTTMRVALAQHPENDLLTFRLPDLDRLLGFVRDINNEPATAPTADN